MTVLNQTIALVYKDNLFTIYDGNQIRQFNSFDGMVNAIIWKNKSHKITIWSYSLSEMVLEVGEDKFDRIFNKVKINNNAIKIQVINKEKLYITIRK